MKSLFINVPMKFYQNFFQSNHIHTDFGMTTVGIYLLTLFKHQITSWLGITSHFIIDNVDEINSVEK
ncbi:unnamed protein product [Rotaria sordida]|uniref:Uncharacterized protein n=1 Tax=Rotaria sordida TaxID=392033 RepID=A0A819E1K2_9BILA|nr:unnamed protein product [Rotaria sordida]